MSISSHSLIAPEGMPLILSVAAIVAVINYLYGMVALPLWTVVLILAWLHRDPLRMVPSSPLGIVSPAEGKVVLVEAHPDPYLGRDAQLIRINMPVTAVYSIRSVIEGKLMQQWLDQESEDEHDVAHALHIRTDEADDVVVVLRPGRIFRRLSCAANIGERIGQGHRCGFIQLGAIIDVYVPLTTRIAIRPGDYVRGGQSLLGEFAPH